MAPAANAQQVLVDDAEVLGSPDVVEPVILEDGQVLTLDPGASISTAGDAVTDLLDGTTIAVNNDGTITSTNGDGINALGSTLLLTNTGTITGGDSGIEAGTIADMDNSGSISGEFGIFAGSIDNLNNSGSITSSNGAAITSFLGTDIINLNNSGNIAGNEAGIDVSGEILKLINSGSTTGGTFGITANGGIGTLNNTGIIVGEAESGIFSGGTIADLNNSGTIIGGTEGIFADTITKLTNSGTIIGQNGIAIQEDGAGDTQFTMLAGSNIQGLVDLGGGTNTLVVGNGLNMVTTFATAPEVIDTNGAPSAVQGTTVAVVDPTGFAAADNAISDLVSSVSTTFTSRLNESGNGTALALGAPNIDGTDISVTPVADMPAQYGASANAPASTGSGQRGAWLKAFGGVNEINGTGPSVDARNLFGGFALGIDRRASKDLRLGVFGGIAAGQVEVDGNIQDIKTDSYFGGVYGRHDARGWSLDFAVTAGVSDHDSKRVVANNLAVGGLETARGDFNGWFVAPEVTFGTEVQAGGRKIKPSLRARYVGMWFDGYSEKGSTANLSVDDRDVHTLEARLQLALPLIDTPGRNFELRAGVDGRAILGNDNVDATLLAQQIEFGPGGKDESLAGFIGASYADRISSNTQLFLSSEVGTGTETDIQATAQAGVRINF